MPQVNRPVSRNLVAMLIDMKKYIDAGEVVSGTIETFATYSRQLNGEIAKAQEMPSGVGCLDLVRVIDTARLEINDHRSWQDEILSNLPKEDDESGETGPLRQAFSKSAIARNELLQEIMNAHDKYLKAQAGAFKLTE